jgi:GTP cyclohydrolase I
MHYKKAEIYNENTLENLADYYQGILTAIGEDVTREGLEKNAFAGS